MAATNESIVTLAQQIGKQTQTDMLAFTDTKALTVFTIMATPRSHVFYQVWNHGMHVVQTTSLEMAINAYNAAE